jgi:hypothetical protein
MKAMAFFFQILYNRVMKKIFAVLLIVITAVGCGVLNRNKNLDVVLKLDREKLKQSSILIFNFKEPSYAEGAGAYAAEAFQTHLLKAKKFKIVSLDTSSPWNRLGETEEERILALMEDGRDRKFDYVMVGELKEFYYGGLNKTRVKIRVRILETATRTTVFLADNYKEDEGNASHYPMNPNLAKQAQTPKKIAEKIIKEFVNEI